MEKIYFKLYHIDGVGTSGTHHCNYYPNIYIGSIACSECQFCAEINIDEQWIKCPKLNDNE